MLYCPPMSSAQGLIVSSWESEGKIYATGRLQGGKSFALMLPAGGGALFVAPERAEEAMTVAAPLGGSLDPEFWSDLSGQPYARIRLRPGSRSRVERALLSAGIPVPEYERGGVDETLSDFGVASSLEIQGGERPGRRVDRVFTEAVLKPSASLPPLRWLALDIETARDETVLAVSLAEAWYPGISASSTGDNSAGGEDPRPAGRGEPEDFRGEVLFLGPELGIPWITSFPDEASLLRALADRVGARDPDVITGWNLIDFDLSVLERRFARHGLPFLIGRTTSPAGTVERPGKRPVFDVPGRAAIDAMRLFRASGERFEDQSLETVSREVLGEGKSVSARGEDKLAELERLRAEEPESFCSYCLKDSTLVLRLLAKTGLAALTAKRAALTGLSLDLAWTSIPAFERVYDSALRMRRVIPPRREGRVVSGAAGGTVLDPLAGIFEAVLVFDFRSLYPSLMRTFNIDPLSHARAESRPLAEDDIIAPNGARFERTLGILPDVIARYSAEREAALAAGDDTAAYVYKILQNSFYGVLGAEGCRYARTELAGAITSFARKYLTYSRDFFEAKGYRVLYGDTDSVFVLSGRGGEARYEELAELGDSLQAELNPAIAADILKEHGLASFLKIRCEKAYARFFIPRLRMESGLARGAILRREELLPEGEPEGDPLGGADGPDRADEAPRGRAKGYAGLMLLPGGEARLEIKGMEAARSDGTALAKRFQVELLGLAFDAEGGGRSPAGEEAVAAYCRGFAQALRRGELDSELLYRSYLRRPASEYGSETPPVRAARLLGWTNRRGRVSYLMTKAGAEPPERRSSASIDYDHYVEKQLLPIARALAEAAGWNAEPWLADRPQMELAF